MLARLFLLLLVCLLTTTGAWGSASYTYDTRGNIIGDGKSVFIYDRANQPTAISGGGTTGSFVYDGNYKRVKQVINGEIIYSFYSLSGEMVWRENVTTGKKTDYIKLGAGGMTLLRCADTCQYIHSDHLGTPVTGTAANGNMFVRKTIRRIVFCPASRREAFTPFGESLNEPNANLDQQGFTGHIRDSDTGLTYMQARYYDPVIGRFLSNDPVGFAQGGVNYFNRYSYTANDPINNTDPTGRQSAAFFAPPAGLAAGGLAIRARATAPQLRPTGSGGGGVPILRMTPIAVALAVTQGITDSQMAGPEDSERQVVNLDTNAIIAMVENPTSEAGVSAFAAVAGRDQIISPQAASEFAAGGDPVSLAALAAASNTQPGVTPSPEMVLGLMMQGLKEGDARVVGSGIETAGAKTLTRDKDVLRKVPEDTETF